MWSKIFQWASQNKNVPAISTQNIVQTAIQEINNAISKNKISLEETKKTQKELNNSLQIYLKQINTLEIDAKNAVKRNDDQSAKDFLNKKNWAGEQAKQYQALHKQVSETVQELERQIAVLELRNTEIHTKEAMLNAKLQKVNTDREMQSYLAELDQTLGFDAFSNKIETINLENQIAQDIISLDSFDDINAENDLKNLQNNIVKEGLKEEQQKINQLMGRYFKPESAKKTTEDSQKITALKNDLLHKFFAQKELPITESNDKNIVNKLLPNINPKETIINNFFENTAIQATKLTQEDIDIANKKKIVDDFFKN